MKSLNKYITEKLVIFPSQVNEKLVIFPSQVNEKLVINKEYKRISNAAPNELCKIFDKYNKEKLVLDNGWGFLVHEKNMSDLWNDARDAFRHKLANDCPTHENITNPETYIKDGNVLATFIWHPEGMTVDSIIIFTAQLDKEWHGLKYVSISFPFFFPAEAIRVNITIRKEINKVHSLVGTTWVVPASLFLEMFDYIYDNDTANAMNDIDYATIKELLIKHIGE